MLFGACDNFNDPESPYLEKYVVFGNISGNMPMIDDTIYVSRSASLDEKIDADQLWIKEKHYCMYIKHDSRVLSSLQGC